MDLVKLFQSKGYKTQYFNSNLIVNKEGRYVSSTEIWKILMAEKLDACYKVSFGYGWKGAIVSKVIEPKKKRVLCVNYED